MIRLGTFILCFLSVFWALPGIHGQTGSRPIELGFVTLPSGAAPMVAMALSRRHSMLAVTLRTTNPDKGTVSASLGVAGALKPVIVQSPQSQREQNGVIYSHFKIPVSNLIVKSEDWARLRLAFRLAWYDPSGRVVRQERFRHTDGRAVYVPLSNNPMHWAEFDITAYDRFVDDQRNGIRFSTVQPMDGKLTLVIEDSKGNRIRNLISGKPYKAGTHTVMWDGLDESGQLVSPGQYRWRSISHPGLIPEYKMAFGNGDEDRYTPFGPNHSAFQAVTGNKRYAFLAAPLTEGGHSLLAVDKHGRTQRTFQKLHGTGMYHIAAAADDVWFYTINDGLGWGQRVDKKKKNWKVNIQLALTRYDIASQKSVDWPGKQRYSKVSAYEWGPGSKQAASLGGYSHSLQGMCLYKQNLYVSLKHVNGVLVVDTKTGKAKSIIPVDQVGPIATHGDSLYVVSGKTVMALNPKTKQARPVQTLSFVPRGMAVNTTGDLYVIDPEHHVVVVYRDGKRIKAIGTPGGSYQGAYDPSRMVNPCGLAFAQGQLWVAEDRGYPKRVGAWDPRIGKPILFKYGNPGYGSPSAGMDQNNENRWIGMGAQWQVDTRRKTATPTHLLYKEGGHLGGLIPYQRNYRYFKKSGRTFVSSMGRANLLSELLPDGSLKDLAFVSNVHSLLYQFNWKKVPAYANAVEAKWPNAKHDARYINGQYRYAPVVWCDRNGDGLLQTHEFDIGDAGQHVYSHWGNIFHEDSFKFVVKKLAKKGSTYGLVTLIPQSYDPYGAPVFPALQASIASATPIDVSIAFKQSLVSRPSGIDRFGNTIVLSEPMVGISPLGRLSWQFPNNWSGVHGSHNAPLPQSGVLQGSLFMLGMVPFDDQGDVFIVNGNHGRFFCMTSDGMFLDEIFSDVRVSRTIDEHYVGSEPFGGSFTRSSQSGRYYVQTGNNGYRIYHLKGLDGAKRDEGDFSISQAQIASAERQLSRREQRAVEPKRASLARIAGPLDPKQVDSGFSDGETITWKNGKHTLYAKLAMNEHHLYVRFRVTDNSPWVNNGKDWTLLFKTGDSVDIQLGTDPKAKSNRQSPAPGDLRLLIAPFEGKPLAVLYKHRVPGATSPVTFSSPWRSETVDDVRRVTSAVIHVVTEAKGYSVVAQIPRNELGLSSKLIGKTIKADVGVLFGDAAGKSTGLRSYWANKATGLVSDVPGEIMLFPHRWGQLHIPSNQRSSEARHRTGTQPKRTLSFAGVVGNSGEFGKHLISFKRSKGAPGMGVVVDRFKRLYERAGEGRLNRYTLDGTLDASFSIPGGQSRFDRLSLVGDTLIMLIKNRVYTLNINGDANTKPKVSPLKDICFLSTHAHRGNLLVGKKIADKTYTFLWFDPASHDIKKTELPTHKYVLSIEVLPDGTPVVYEQWSGIHQYGGASLKRVKGKFGGRLQFINGYWYAQDWHSTIKRFNSAFIADPGVVLGGSSGHFIGSLPTNGEIGHGAGMAFIEPGLFAVSGKSAVVFILRWDTDAKRFVEVRRIGAKPGTQSVALDREGNIFSNSGIWRWHDGPASPQTKGIELASQAQCAILPDDSLMVFGRRYGYPGHAAVAMGNAKGGIHLAEVNKNKNWGIFKMKWNRHHYGSVWYREKTGGKGKGVLLIMNDKNQANALYINPGRTKHAFKGAGGRVTLQVKQPINQYRSLAMHGPDTLLAAADGKVIWFARQGHHWKEISRFNGGSTPFGEAIDISCDSDLLWVSDTTRHRVYCFDAGTRRLIASYGGTNQDALHELSSPKTIAARGQRAVVFDAGNQRLVKLELK